MARDFLASQIRTNQIIASRSFSSQPSLFVISASNANGLGAITPTMGAGSDTFLFVSGSRSSDALVVLGGSVKISGSLTVFDNVTLGQSAVDVIDFEGRIGSNVVPSSNKSYILGNPSFQWLETHSSTGSFEHLSVSQRGIFPSQLSGSIQRTSAGISYLVAGTGVTIASASNGQITISSAGGAGTPGGSNTQVQFNDSGAFGGDDGLVYDKSTKTLIVGNLLVTGSVTAITTSNLTVSDPIIYLASGSSGPNVKSVIAFASGSQDINKSLIFGSIGANDIFAFARQDVQGGTISQSSLSFTDLAPIRASKLEIGGPGAALTSSDASSVLLFSDAAGSIKIVPGSIGLSLGNSLSSVAISGSNVRFGSDSSEFGGEIPPIPGNDVYLFVSGSGSSKRALFGGDAVTSGSFIVKASGGSTAVIANPLGVLSASSNIQGGGNLLIAGNATARGGLLTLSNTAGDAAINQDGSGNFTIRNLVSGGQFLASVRTSGGVTSNFLDVRPNGSLTGSVISIFPSSIYAGASNPFFSTDTTFFVAGKRGAKDGINRGTAVFGGDAVISGSAYIGSDGTDKLVILANIGSDIIPDSNVTRNLGSPVRRFANVYTGDLHLKNDRGDYTLIEEEECLTIRFNKTGKRYKFVLEPAPEFD
jgi:hypothetical protein